jgi:hypothetical protein
MVSFVSRAAIATGALVMVACSVGVDGLGGGDGGSSPTSSSSTVPPNALDASDPGTADDGDMDSSSPVGTTNPDAGRSHPAMDASEMDAPSTVRPPFDASACDGAMGTCVVVPPGWSLVAFATTRAAMCPAGFGMGPGTDVVEGPSAAGGCSCGACAVTTPPSCTVGEINGFYDTKRTAVAGLCSTPDTTPVLMNDPPGACATDIYNGAYGTFDVEYDGPAASGGACSAPGVSDSSAITYAAEERVCTASAPAASCTGDVCRPMLPAGFAACIAIAGDQPCPQGPLGAAHLVGTSATLQCSDCGCTTTGSCEDGSITLYTDTGCSKGGTTIDSSTCTAINGNPTYASYKYDGGSPTGVSCMTGAPGTPGVTLGGEQTICCAQ